jgi:cytochrome P450
MTTTTGADELSGVPIAELATRPDPARWHQELRALGTHSQGDQWIVSSPLDVATALTAPDLHVIPPTAGAGPAADLIGGMARFREGEAHRRGRALTVMLLPPLAEITARARDCAAHFLRERATAEVLDVMPLARTIAAEALGRAMGLRGPDAASAADATGRLCDALVSGQTSDADEAATQLRAAIRPLRLSDEGETVAAASILFQARDATAALVGAAALAPARAQLEQTAVRVDSVLRRQAPVQCTRRSAVADTTIGAAFIPRGSEVWIFLAAAELGNGRPATFGTGPHGCPAADEAAAIARAVLTVLDEDGLRPVPGQHVDHEQRPNLRLPCRVLVSRA